MHACAAENCDRKGPIIRIEDFVSHPMSMRPASSIFHPSRLPLLILADDQRMMLRRVGDRVADGDPPTSQLGPVGLGPAQAGHDALADHRPLEFREDPQHLKHRLSRRGRRVEPLLCRS